MTDEQPPLWRTAEEIAGLFGVQVRTVWAWRRRGHIAAVDGRYDLRRVLHWWDHSRDTRRAETRQGVARPAHPRVYLDRQRPHAQSLSDPTGTVAAVDFGPSFVANGTAASFASPSQPIMAPTIVYYLRVGSLIKIGQSVDLASRLRAYPPGSALLATEVGERDELEAERLAQFDADRAHRREWFHPSAALVGHINSLREQPLTPAELAT